MKRKNLIRAYLIALIIVAGVERTLLFGTEASAQTSEARARSLPMFEVDSVVAEGAGKVEARRCVQHRHRCAGQCLGPAPSADAQAGTGRHGRAAGDRVRCGGQFHQGLGRGGQRL